MTKHSWYARSLALTLAICFLVAETLAVTHVPELPDPGRAPISKEEQEKMGAQAAAEVYKQMPVLPDNSPETQYIQQVGRKLVSVIPPEYNWPYRFHVVAQKEINAFALPGGEMFVNVGTITAAQNEAQLIGVMAHEMSHVYMMHSAKQMGKASTLQGLAGLAGAILGGSNSVWAGLARAGVQIGAGTVMMKYSRTDEAQADAVGAIMMYKARYNPQALADFFQTLASQGGGGGPQFLSDHPNPGNREAAIQKEIAEWPPKQYQNNSSAFQSARQHATGVRVYTAQEIQEGAKSGQWAALNKKNGAVFAGNPAAPAAATSNEGQMKNVSLPDIRPSGTFKALNLDFLQMQYPDNWRVTGDQQQSAITVAPPSAVSGNNIAYGVFISGAQPSNGSGMNLDQMTNEIIGNLRQATPEMQQVGRVQPIKVNGLTGRSVDLSSPSPIQGPDGQPQRERDWLVTVPRGDGSAIFLVFIAPQNDFDQLRPTYESMLKTLRVR